MSAVWTGTPKDWTVGEFIVEADLDAISAFMTAASDTLDPYTVTITQGGNAVTKTGTSEYRRLKYHAEGFVDVSITSNSGGTGAIRISAPVTASGTGRMVGDGTYLNQDGTSYPVLVRMATTTTFELVRSDAPGTSTSAVGSDPAIECSTGDQIHINFDYETA